MPTLQQDWTPAQPGASNVGNQNAPFEAVCFGNPSATGTAITSITVLNGVVTVNSTSHGLTAGSLFSLTGTTNQIYNINGTVSTATANSFTFPQGALPPTGQAAAAGTVYPIFSATLKAQFGQNTVITLKDPGAAAVTLGLGLAQVNSLTTTPIALTQAQAGQTFVLNLATGITVTLPAPVVGTTFKILIGTSVTSGAYKIITSAGTIFLVGSVEHSATGIAPLNFWANGSSIVSISMDGAHLGGLIGTELTFTCISATEWQVNGTNLGTATMTTAFATS